MLFEFKMALSGLLIISPLFLVGVLHEEWIDRLVARKTKLRMRMQSILIKILATILLWIIIFCITGFLRLIWG